jgi:cysteinyl-tRNA synthetase
VDWSEAHAQRFAEAMNDDFNTPIAIAVLFDLVTEANRHHSPAMARQLRGLGAVLGLLTREPHTFLQGAVVAGGLADEEVAVQIAARAQAKKDKNFAEADRIRGALIEQGIVLEDKPGGITEWRRA